jgi:hypothetical protein
VLEGTAVLEGADEGDEQSAAEHVLTGELLEAQWAQCPVVAGGG